MNRYAQLIPLIAKAKPETILEVGTWNGHRALLMVTEALKHKEKVHYIGYDLFEHASEKTDAREFNVKSHHKRDDVAGRLSQFQSDNPGFSFELHRGDTRYTLADFNRDVDFAFIDGGHSIETISGDMAAIAPHAKVLVLDDFYEPKDGHPDIEKFGCNRIVEEGSFVILDQADNIRGGGKVRMCVSPPEAIPGPKNLKIKTKNCVPDEEIQANVRYSISKLNRWVRKCKPNMELVIMCGGGPSLDGEIENIRAGQEAGAYVVAVKHAHDKLIEAGIIPWGCMLLDPRSHVQDFIENPHPAVTYFVASMCHPTTVDRLVERNATIWSYHAHVGAGEEEIVKQNAEHFDPKEAILLGGGSTSAMRGISVLHALGFRRFHLYGCDSSYPETQDTSVKTKTGHQKYYKCESYGRKFWTDSELLAQAQDFDFMAGGSEKNGVRNDPLRDFVELECYGDGMIQHIWTQIRPIAPDFRELMRDVKFGA